jgi:hypothetical protein
MACNHYWYHWPFSADSLCLRCNYQVIGDVHYPLGNPKWMAPQPQTAEVIHNGIRYVVPEAAIDDLRTQLGCFGH